MLRDIAEVVLPILLFVAGYLLREISARREAQTRFDRRWDQEKRTLYSTYLAAVDEYHKTVKRLKRVDGELEDTATVVETYYSDELATLGEGEIAERERRLRSVLKDERAELWERRDRTKARIGQLTSELEILTDAISQVNQIGLEISAGDDERYKENRKEYLKQVRKDLQLPDYWPKTRKKSLWDRALAKLRPTNRR